MAQISKRFLDKDLEKRITSIFTRTIKDLKNELEIENFISDLLSPTERTMLFKRLAIAVMLTKGYTYETIDHVLKVSTPKIMAVSTQLKHSTRNGYKKITRKILDWENKEALLDKIEEILLTL